MVRFNKQMVCLFVLSLFALGSAQRETSPERLWHSDTALFDAAYSVAYDPAGNVIVAGFFQGELAGVSAQGRDAFVASLTNEGEVNWLSHLGGAGDDKALNVTTDDDGNVFVVGYVSGEATLGEVTLGEVTLGDSELASTFVAKFASDGSLQWAQSLASTGVTYGYGVAADGAGGVFVAGFFSGDINLVDAVTAQGSSDIFALHLDAEGNPQWFTALGGDAGDVAYDVARDSAGNLYLAGRFRDTVDFVTLDGDVTLTALGDRDALLISLTEAGEVRWAQSWGGDGADVVWSVATFDNRVYTAGYFSGYANLDPEADPDLRLRAGGTLDSFVAAFDDSGQFQWGRQRSSSGLASAHDLTVDRLGVIYEVGRASDSLPGAGVGPLRGYLSQYNEDGDRINDLMLDVSSVQGVAVSDALTAYLAAYGEIVDAGVTDTSEDAMTVSASAEAQVWQLVQVAPEVDEPTLDVTDDVTDTSEDVTSEDVASEDVATDEAPTEETSADETVTDEASADETTTDDAVSDETSVEDISNEGVPIDEVTVEDVAPEPVEDPSTEDAEPELEDVPAEDVSAEDVVPEDAPSEDDLTDEADVDAVADETETSSEGTSSENAPEPASSTDSSTTDSVTDDVQSTPESGSSDTETSPSDSN
jgi:hypothetical protein